MFGWGSDRLILFKNMSSCLFCGKEVGEGSQVCEGCSKNVIQEEITENRESQTEQRPEVSEELVEAYRIFDKTFNPKRDVIYYPSCGFDSSLSVIFPDSRIIYVDSDKESVSTLKKLVLKCMKRMQGNSNQTSQ